MMGLTEMELRKQGFNSTQIKITCFSTRDSENYFSWDIISPPLAAPSGEEETLPPNSSDITAILNGWEN